MKTATLESTDPLDLSVEYLGLRLEHPFLPGASPLADDLDTVRKLEDAGAAAITLRSLFEEQIVGEEVAASVYVDGASESFAEATSYLPSPDSFVLGPDEYLEHLQQVRSAVQVPVIASLNGNTLGGWLEYAGLMEEAGAHALELNVYELATDPSESAADVEKRTLEMVRAVKEKIGIPVAVKLSPFYTSLANFAIELDLAGADGVVLFNRFYQPDIDIEDLDVSRTLHLSDSSELLLRLRWLAVLSGKLNASLAVTGGVHTPEDAIKAIMCGAHAVQVVSSLLRIGPGHLRTLQEDMVRWMQEHEYTSLEQMRGSMSLRSCPDPHAFERANYMHILQGWGGYYPRVLAG